MRNDSKAIDNQIKTIIFVSLEESINYMLMLDHELKEIYIDPRTASIPRFTPTQLREYEDSVKAYRDIVNAVNTARKEGLEEGLEKGIEKGIEEGLAKGERKKQVEIARTLKGMGLDISAIH